MTEKIRILFLSANPWTTARILVDEEEREIFEKLQEGPYRERFEVHRHAAIRPIDLQRLLMLHEPHIVHFSGHGSKQHKIILGGKPGRGKQVDQDGFVKLFSLYKSHVRLVVLNACFTKTQAESLAEVIDYSIGAGKGIGDKEGVAFAGAFYRALSFGKSVKAAFESAEAELALTKMPRTKGLGLFMRKGVEADSFPNVASDIKNKTEDPRAFVPLTSHADSYHDSSFQQKKVTETDGSALELLGFGDRLSLSNLTSLGKVRPVRQGEAKRRQGEIERRSSVRCSRSYVTFTVKVIKVAISDSKCDSHIARPGKHQAVRSRVKNANKHGRSGRSKSDNSD